MSQSRKVPYNIIRFKNFLLLLLKNKRSILGITVLMLFIAFAISAPYLNPGSNQSGVVSGFNDEPDWVHYLTGRTDWSHNSAFTGLTVLPTQAVRITSQSDNSVTFTVDASKLSGQPVLVEKTLVYSYSGTPREFEGNIQVSPQGLNGTAGAAVTVSLEKVGVQKYCCLWSQSGIGGGNYSQPRQYAPGTAFSSNDPDLKARLGFGNTGFDPATILFLNSKGRSFIYTTEITLPPGVSQATFTITDFRMFLSGSVWGVMGTNNIGEDLFSQLAFGARVSIEVGLLATFLGIGIGLVVGLLAGYLSGVVDEVLMRFTDMMLVLPGLPLLIVLVAVLGSSTLNVIGVLGFLGWMGFARIIRAQVLSLRERPFIEAAKASGAGTGYITVRHIFPNIVGLTYVNLALAVPAAIVGEAALSFLGLGASGVSWGSMLEAANSAAPTGNGLVWWWILPPGLCIALLSLSFILIGYSLDEIFNPRLRRRR